MQELRDVWTFKVRQGQSGPRSTASTSYETVVLEDGLIEKLDHIKEKVSSRCKTADTSFSAADKTFFVQVLEKIDSKSTQHALPERD